MRSFLSAIFCSAAMICGGISAANAAVIASCGPMKGYTYHFQEDSPDGKTQWIQDALNSTTIFLGKDKVEEVVIKSSLAGDSWTRSATEYGATVAEINRDGLFRHIMIFWGSATEIYALDMENKLVSLVSQKSNPFKLTLAFVGKCE